MQYRVIWHVFQFKITMIAVGTHSFSLDQAPQIRRLTWAAVVAGVAGVGLHCDTSFQYKPPRSVLTNVIVPLTVNELMPIRSIFPPPPNVTGPPKVKNVTISPGPNPL